MTDDPKPIDLDKVLKILDELRQQSHSRQADVLFPLCAAFVTAVRERDATIQSRNSSIALLGDSMREMAAERDALKEEVERYKETEAYVGVSLDIERDALRDRVAKLEAGLMSLSAAVLEYDASIAGRAARGEVRLLDYGGVVTGVSLDALYFTMKVAAERAAELLREGRGK